MARNRESIARMTSVRYWWRPCLLVLLVVRCGVHVASNPTPRLVKVGADDVHDEQSREDRIKVLTILRRLQAASMADRLAHQEKNDHDTDEDTDYREITFPVVPPTSSPFTTHPSPPTTPPPPSESTPSIHTDVSNLSDETYEHAESNTDASNSTDKTHGHSDSNTDLFNSGEKTNEMSVNGTDASNSSAKIHKEFDSETDGSNSAVNSDKTDDNRTSDALTVTNNPQLMDTNTNRNIVPSSSGNFNTDTHKLTTSNKDESFQNTTNSESPDIDKQESTTTSKQSVTDNEKLSENISPQTSNINKQQSFPTSTSKPKTTQNKNISPPTPQPQKIPPMSSTSGPTGNDDNLFSESKDGGEIEISQFTAAADVEEFATEVEEAVETGLLFEGDIMLSATEAEEVFYANGQRRRKRKVTYSQKKRWSLPIPYTFDQNPKFKLNDDEIRRVKEAIAHLESLTCITFLLVNSSYPVGPILSFKKDTGCWSYVGKEQAFRFQEVSTGEGCFEMGTLLHELGHAIGFWHEHSRPDRKDFIRVHTERVRLGEEFNFKVESWGQLDNMDVPYDVGSIMHYGSTYFSRSGREITVESLDPRLQRVLGQRLEMSFFDIKLANKAYCNDTCKDTTLKCQHEGYPDPKHCDRCRCPPGLSGTLCENVAFSNGLTCGGLLHVEKDQKYSISSPSHPWLYPSRIQCTWLIKTEPNRQIVLNVDKRNFMNRTDCSPYQSTVCLDYLEVKYNVSFGFTGARYCCGVAPQEPLRSSGSSMLVIFVQRQTGLGGFMANITSEPCGGCQSGTSPQPACRKQEERECLKVWNTTKYVPCPVSIFKSSNCNKKIRKQESRLGVCTSEVEYCCEGCYVNNSYCYPSTNNTSLRKTSSRRRQSTDDTGTTDIGQDADMSWSPWSSWSSCSRSCGGCGLQTRKRTCDIPTRCGGKAKEVTNRVCNTFPCPQVTVYMCTTTRIKDYFCGWGKCSRQVTETGPCYTICCPGYRLSYGKCVPKT